jgi:transcriptional regulator with XRE-family HTH domain
MNNFSSNLRHRLEKQHLSVQALADLAGMRRSYLSRILHGHHSPSERVMTRIANALGIELAKLLKKNNPTR